MPAMTAAAAADLFRAAPERLIDVGAGEVAYRRVGSGPDVLFVHGWPVSGATFRSLLPYLADRVTCHLIDLPGAALSEQMSPADVVTLLNTYFGLMGEILDRHHGCVVEFTGDGFLCVFGAPQPMADHAERAVRCALEMQARLADAHGEWGQLETKLWHGQGTAHLRMRIGIHTGAVIAGNIGTPSREQYSVIGDAVNVAARVEQLNKDLNTDTLLTQETLIRLPDALRGRARARGEHQIRGRTQLVTVYEIY